MKLSQFLHQSGRTVAYLPALVPCIGSIEAVLILCQLAYWNGKQDDDEGWIYKTHQELQRETGLTRSQQRTARKVLRDIGVLSEELRGDPPIIHYLVDYGRLENLWTEWVEAHPPEGPRKPRAKAKRKAQHENI